MNDSLRHAIERAVGFESDAHWRHVGATGWGDAWSLAQRDRRHFVKLAHENRGDVLDCEADGLRAIASTKTIRVPNLIAVGAHGHETYLVVEWLEMTPAIDRFAAGRALARMHRAAPPCGPAGQRFGWHRDNWIGGTAQANDWSDDWCTFFRDRRLAPQLALAEANGFRGSVQRDGERVLARLPSLLRTHDAQPSLVHGDLWSGNAGTLADGEPVVFDPAVYIGDREVDIAMTELFGGFGRELVDAYEAQWPLDAGYPLRRDAYNLYHLLNHLNLFGAGYRARVEQTMARILATAG